MCFSLHLVLFISLSLSFHLSFCISVSYHLHPYLSSSSSLSLFISLPFHLSFHLHLFSHVSFSLILVTIPLSSFLSHSCHVSLSMTMTMITHSVSSLSPSVRKAQTFPEDQRAWTLAQSLFGELLASRRKNLSRVSCASRVPLGMKWGGTCAGDGDVPMVWCACGVVCCVVLRCVVLSHVVSCRLVSVVLLLVRSCVLDCHCCVANIMNCQEHNRSWKGMFCAKKKQDLTSTAVQKKKKDM